MMMDNSLESPDEDYANNGRLTMTIKEFAQLAGISKNQAYALAATDSLGVYIIRFGRRMVLPRKVALNLLLGKVQGSEQ